MQLRRVEGSAVVDSAGFEDGVLRVLFRSGNWKDFPGRTAEDLEELLRAPSKGRFVHERLSSSRMPAAATPLDTFESDECCSIRLARDLLAGKLAGVDLWTCPKCSVEWVAAAATPPLGRHWKPRVWAVRF